MHKVEEKQRMITDTVHHFYCDDCGKHLGSSVEYQDGYYDEYGGVGLQIHVDCCWYNLSKCLCEECREIFMKKTQAALEDMGFVKR